MLSDDASEQGERADFLSGLSRHLLDDYSRLLQARDRAEQELLQTLSHEQKAKLLLLQEALDELHMVYTLAAFQAGRQAGLDSPVQTPEAVRALLRRVLAALADWHGTQGAGEMGDVPARPIEEELMELARQVPDEEWAKLPPDLTDDLDHYLYGTPRR